MKENTYKTHQKILGAIFIAYGVFNILGGLILLAAINVVSIFVDEMDVIQLVTIFSHLIGSILIVTAVPGIIAGIGYIREQSWAKILGLIVGIVYLLFIPVGTVIGIYAIWLNVQTVIEEKKPVYATDLVKESKK